MTLSACTTSNVRLKDSNSLLVNKFGVLCNPQGAIRYDRRKVTCKSQGNSQPYVSKNQLTALVQTDLLDAQYEAKKNNSNKIKLLVSIALLGTGKRQLLPVCKKTGGRNKLPRRWVHRTSRDVQVRTCFRQ